MTPPQRSSTVHAEAIGGELCLYDWRHGRVHSLNATASLVWQHCDGATSPDAIALILGRELGVPEAQALVRETLRRLAHAQLLAGPVARATDDPPIPTRRALLQRGVAAALLPAIYSIAAPSALVAQSLVAPTLTSIVPAAGGQCATVAVTLTGTHFVAGSTVAISGTGVTVQNVTVVNATTITANLVFDAAATLGARTVTVTTPGGPSGPVPFTVTPLLPPTLTSITPPAGIEGTTVAVTLTGTNFVPGSTVAISGTGVTAQNVTVVNATTITANLVIAQGTTLGPRAVSVATATCGTTGTVTFTVNPDPQPTLTSIVPAAGGQCATVAVTLTGTNFVVGSTVAISGTGVTAQGVTVVNVTTITATFVFDATATLGARTVTVTTPGGTSAPVAFTVNPTLPPTLTGIAPVSGAQGATVAVTLTGTNFIAGSTVAISGTGVTAQGVTVVNGTTITASFVIDAVAAVGPRSVTVATGACGTSAPLAFTVFQSTTTFNFTGGSQNFVVPPGVTHLTVRLNGAAGGSAGTAAGSEAFGGVVGFITATIPVTPGETLVVFVGARGTPGNDVAVGVGGFNGGGNAGADTLPFGGGGGGGASDVRQGGALLANRVLVAGGGGGAGSSVNITPGGFGGGLLPQLNGGAGGVQQVGIIASGGAGGTQSSGGTAGTGAAAGVDGASGVGGQGAANGGASGGGGGGGWFGGGGGGAGDFGGAGGGGGSGFVVATATNVSATLPTARVDGQVVITVV
jgi:hypothetical protein